MPPSPATDKPLALLGDSFSNPHTLSMLNLVSRQLTERGLLPLLLNAPDREGLEAQLKLAAATDISGLLFLSTRSADECQLVQRWLPDVPQLHLCHSLDARAEVVCADDEVAGSELAHLLMHQSHQRFGYMQARDAIPHGQRRKAGYVNRLASAGISLTAQLIAGGDDRSLAYQTMLAYLKQARSAERIHALFCENDALALGALQAVRDFGMGTHIAVVGFDDVAEARAENWQLTSWTSRNDLLVQEALNRLLDQRANEQGAWRSGELQIRQSHLGKYVPGLMTKCGCASRH